MPKHGRHLSPVIGGFACAHSDSSLWKCWTVFGGVEWNAHTSCGVGLVWIPADVRAVKHANHLPAIFKQPAECAQRCCNRSPTNRLYLVPDTNSTLTPPIGGGCGAVAWVRACLTAVSSTCWSHFLNPATLSCWVSSDNVTQAHRAAAVRLTVRLPQCIVGHLTAFIKDVCLSWNTASVVFCVGVTAAQPKGHWLHFLFYLKLTFRQKEESLLLLSVGNQTLSLPAPQMCCGRVSCSDRWNKTVSFRLFDLVKWSFCGVLELGTKTLGTLCLGNNYSN